MRCSGGRCRLVYRAFESESEWCAMMTWNYSPPNGWGETCAGYLAEYVMKCLLWLKCGRELRAHRRQRSC
jgi:hypothetical protein